MADLSPAGWLAVLEPRLDAQADRVQVYRDYYDGRHRLAFATQKFRDAFLRFFPPMSNNWMQIVVDAAVERLEVQGFRFDPDPDRPSWDQDADSDAWQIWQENGLDSASVMAHTEAVKCGLAFTMVDPNGGKPVVTVEHPQQVCVACDPANRRSRLAALKRWSDDDGYLYANVYLPTYIAKFRSKEKVREAQKVEWGRRSDDPGGQNRLGAVPVIPLENNPDMLIGGRSDLEVAIPIQDAINKLCLDMQVSSEFHAYPQRWATGWEVPRMENPADPSGDRIVDRNAALKASQASAWVSEDADTKFGQLEPGQVENYIKPIELYVRHLAAQTRTPPHYLLGEIVNASGDSMKMAETGLDFRCKRKTLDFSDGWEDTIRLAFAAKGDTSRSGALQAETLWAPTESQNLAQVMDAAVKFRTSLSGPIEMAWQMIGFSPQQIKQGMSIVNLPPGGPPPPSSSNGTDDPDRVVLPAGIAA